MKKFLQKLPVMISLLVVTALLAGLYVGLLVRPVAYGWKYTYSKTTTNNNETPNNPNDDYLETENITIVVNDNKLATVTYGEKAEKTYDSQTVIYTTQYWYIKDGNKIVVLNSRDAMTEEQYNEAVKDYWTLNAEDKENYGSMTITANTFKMDNVLNTNEEEISLKCAGTIVYTVLMGIALATATAFASLSVVFFIKSKKKPLVKEETVENQKS